MLLTTIRIAKADREINEDERILISALIESSDELSKGDKRSLAKQLESPASTPLFEEVECFSDPFIRMGIFIRAVEGGGGRANDFKLSVTSRLERSEAVCEIRTEEQLRELFEEEIRLLKQNFDV